MSRIRNQARNVHRRVNQNFLCVVKSIDWSKFVAVVEFKDSPGLLALGRIFGIGGAGGTLYPPMEVGDVVEARVTGTELAQLMRSRSARRINASFFYDRSDVIIGLGGYMDAGEPAGRKAGTPPNTKGWLLVTSDGSEIRYDPATKEWVWKLAEGGKLYLGGKVGAKKVLVDGDGNGAGGVGASQSGVWIGTPS